MARSFVRIFCALLALSCLAGCIALEQAILFHPARYPDGNWQDGDVPHEDAKFKSDDGTALHGWYASVPNPRAVVLFCHGNAGNITRCNWVLSLFTERLNCSILAFDYRGYGKSEGSPTEAGILADARAARKWLSARTGVAEKDIIVVGRSLGGAVAVDLAAKDGARALILQNTFASLRGVADHHASPIPVHWMMALKLDSAKTIQQYHGPLLQSHGDADRIVPFEQGQKLFAAANEPKTFFKAPGGGHNDRPTIAYVNLLDDFLGRLAPLDREPKGAKSACLLLPKSVRKKRGQAPLCEAPFGPFRQRCLTPFLRGRAFIGLALQTCGLTAACHSSNYLCAVLKRRILLPRIWRGACESLCTFRR